MDVLERERERGPQIAVLFGEGERGWWLTGWLEVGIYMQVDIIVVAAGEEVMLVSAAGRRIWGVWLSLIHI